jgi:hypothetical protein
MDHVPRPCAPLAARARPAPSPLPSGREPVRRVEGMCRLHVMRPAAPSLTRAYAMLAPRWQVRQRENSASSAWSSDTLSDDKK